MANTTTATSSLLSLREILHIYLLCFDAAADAIPLEPVAYTVPCRHPGIPVPIWQVWTCKDLENGPPEDFDRLSWQPEKLYEALGRKDMCEAFCILLEEEINNKVREVFNARTRWLIFRPKIKFLLASRSGQGQFEIAAHSVLLIQTEDRQEMVMDGTLRQYLWAKSTWLQSKEDWEAKRVDKTHGGRGYEIASQDYKEVDEQLLSRVDMGFWLIARQRMKSLFEELDWHELEGLEAGERIERVKQIAQDKFAGAWEEACDLHKQAYEED